MNQILSTTFLSLSPDQQHALMERSVLFYYPEWEDMIMSDAEWR